MNKNPSPRTEFLAVKAAVDQHNRLLEMPSFQKAIAVAKAEYTRRLHAIAPDKLDSANFMAASAMCFQRIQGMEDFCDVLMHLGEPIPVLAKIKDQDNLKMTSN